MTRYLAILAAWLALPLAALAQPVPTAHAVAELISERAAAVPGDRFLGALKLDLEKGGWHVYWQNPGDSGLPPEIEWTKPDGVTTGDFVWPVPHPIRVADLMNYGYKDQLVLPFDIVLPDDLQPGQSVELVGDASWLICLETCVPESAELRLTIPISSALQTNDEASAAIGNTLSAIPQVLSGEAHFLREEKVVRVGLVDATLSEAVRTSRETRLLPDGHDIQHAADQVIRYGAEGIVIEAPISDYADEETSAFGGVIFIEAADGSTRGWRFDAAPGPIPVGLSDHQLTTSAGTSVGGWLSMIGFAFIGGLILNLMPCVLPVLSIKAAGLVQSAHDPAEARAHGLAYLAGVLVCFLAIGVVMVALRSAGEQVGFGFQLQYPPMIAFFVLLLFAVGLNLLGVFEIGTSVMGMGGSLAQKNGTTGAFFTGMLAGLVGAPCVGPFLGVASAVALTQPAPIVLGVFAVIGLGMAAPFVLISFTPALARLLPKPGKWMETLRQALAFPMFATGIWLLWVLAGQAGSNAVVLVVAGATLLGFGIWLAKKIKGGVFGRAIAGLIILAALIGPSVGSNFLAPTAVAGDLQPTAYNEETWSPQRVAELRAEGRVVFVDFTARWCVTCQVNKIALHSGQSAEAFEATNTAFLVADWTNRDEVIASALAEHGRAGVPLYLVYPNDGGEPEVLPQVLTSGVVAKAVRRAYESSSK